MVITAKAAGQNVSIGLGDGRRLLGLSVDRSCDILTYIHDVRSQVLCSP